MSSQIPNNPVTPEAMARLTLDEQMAFLAATGAVAQDQKPSLEVIATVVLTVQRLITEAAAVPADGQRPGDQSLPVPNDGPSMHDLVVSDLDCWPESDEVLTAVRALLEERKQTGLERYKSLLQAHNGRDARRDLLEELADAIVYAHQVHVERGQAPGSGEAFEAYEYIAFALAHAVQIPEAAPPSGMQAPAPVVRVIGEEPGNG